VTAFLAVVTPDATSTPLYLHADYISEASSGSVSLQAPPTSTADEGPFEWQIDGQGRVLLAGSISGIKYALLAGTGGTGIASVLLATFDTVESYVAAGRPLSFVYGAVDPVTKELLLKAGERKTVLLCGTYLSLSNGAAEDTASGVCKVVHPKVVAPLF
jgi:hypothetical protein